VSTARNAGFAQIGDLPFVCFLDSDDLWPCEFIAEALRAFDDREDIVAAVADRVNERSGNLRPVQSLARIAENPLLWLICNDGGVLSCTMIRSDAARSAGLFVPGMVVSEDTDFLLRLFLQGGVAHSKAAPVRFVKRAPLEPSEPLNLSHPTPELRYLWTCHLITSLAKLPENTRRQHNIVIRTAIARRWAELAFFSLKRSNRRLALRGLLRAIWWDYDWQRRLLVVWSFIRGRRSVLAHFSTPFAEPSAEASAVSSLGENDRSRISMA
jgi:cellulose synthase/poly-beta-1,6-N-acetylglucosamine synthase-like glycosyltransferase